MAQQPRPTTPPRSPRPTPTLSSPVTPPLPQTPHTALPTPTTARPHRRRLHGVDISPEDDDDMNLKERQPVMSAATIDVNDDPPVDLLPKASDSNQDDVDESLPSHEQLQEMRDTLDNIQASSASPQAQRDQIAKMLRTLLDAYTTQVPFLQDQITAQQATIASLQQQSQLDKAMTSIERDRFAAERAGWQAESQALIRAREAEIAAGNRQKGILDLDVGYHQELEAANKRLEMDNRLMAPRLVDTQQQIESLVNELRLLRTHVILDSSTFNREDDQTAQSPPIRPREKPRSTMGDARAEHLLLAAKKVRSMRQQDKAVGCLTLEELQRRGVVGPDGGVGYSEGYGGDTGGRATLARGEDEESKPSLSPSYGRPASKSALLLPRPKKAPKRVGPTTPSRSRTTPQAPQTTPGGSNFNDLLLAAEMATRPGTPSRSVGATMSSARSTTWEASIQSPSKRPRRQPPATVEWSTRRHTNEEGEGSPSHGDGSSALDLLAQASQDVAQGSQTPGVLASAARLEGAVDVERPRYRSQSSRSATPLGPAINLEGATRGGGNATPSPFPPGADNPFVNSPGTSAFQSPTGAAVPGLGKYVHLSSAAPARRVRSPYLKWTKEEDELLTRAVMEHGEKWDLVSKCVPTRSYHQVRQRWLRKTGAFDKKPSTSADPSPLGRTGGGEQNSPTPKGRKRREQA